MKIYKYFCLIISFILLFQICGCATLSSSQTANIYFNPYFVKTAIYDVGIIPFNGEDSFSKELSLNITFDFIAELNKRGWYAIHNLSEEDLFCPEKTSKIDAVIKGRVLVYRDREPLKFGLKVSLVDLRTKETLWSSQCIFDTSYQKTVNDIKKYYDDFIEKKYPLTGYKMYLMSMKKFTEYCLNRIIDGLK